MTDITSRESSAPSLAPGLDAAHGRRLSDKVLLAFHQACEQQDTETARQLLDVLDFLWLRDADAPWGRRRNVNYLVPARERFVHALHQTVHRDPRPPLAPEQDDAAGTEASAQIIPLAGRRARR